MLTQNQAKRFIEDHGHVVHVDGDRLIAECSVVLADGREAIEYGTFVPVLVIHYSPREIRDWLGY